MSGWSEQSPKHEEDENTNRKKDAEIISAFAAPFVLSFPLSRFRDRSGQSIGFSHSRFARITDGVTYVSQCRRNSSRLRSLVTHTSAKIGLAKSSHCVP